MAIQSEVVRQVEIGDQKFEIQRFRGLKAILAMAAITRIAREVPDILADTAKAYQRRNTVVITEAMSKLPRWEGFSKEDFDSAESVSGRREIEIPSPMSQQEQFMSALPKLLEEARREVVRLFAILVIPNDDLRIADKEDRVEEALDNFQDVLLYEAEIDQLADLALVSQEVLTEQLTDKKERLGKLLTSLVKMFRTGTEAKPEMSPPSISQIPSDLTPQTSSNDAPTLSTPSEEPTDGQEKKLSTEFLGVS